MGKDRKYLFSSQGFYGSCSAVTWFESVCMKWQLYSYHNNFENSMRWFLCVHVTLKCVHNKFSEMKSQEEEEGQQHHENTTRGGGGGDPALFRDAWKKNLYGCWCGWWPLQRVYMWVWEQSYASCWLVHKLVFAGLLRAKGTGQKVRLEWLGEKKEQRCVVEHENSCITIWQVAIGDLACQNQKMFHGQLIWMSCHLIINFVTQVHHAKLESQVSKWLAGRICLVCDPEMSLWL